MDADEVIAEAPALDHLLPAVRQAALLPATERIQRVRAERWIGYSKAHEALDKPEQLFTHPPRQRMPNLLLIGPTNNGKTMIIEKFRRLHPAAQLEELFCRRGAAGDCADTLVAIWKAVGCQPYAGLTVSKPFERLTLEQQRDALRAVGRLLHDLPESLQQHMPLTPWGSRRLQGLPSALYQMCCPSHVVHHGTPPSIRATPFSPQQIVAALEELAPSDEGAEQLIRFITAYSRRQTSEELWQLIDDIRASPASNPRR
jgi:hypothetical protein